jgi:hypothetical protein
MRCQRNETKDINKRKANLLRACLKLANIFFLGGFRISRIVPFFEVTKPQEKCTRLI